jgi:nucleotide-binding universal stress UspA family protein
MKNLLLLTDFSKSAKHAAVFAYSLAKQIKGRLMLCNTVIVPTDLSMAGLIVWPLPDTGELVKDSESKLKKLKLSLEKNDCNKQLKPSLITRSYPGTPVNVVREISETAEIDFIVMGSHGEGSSSLMLGNHTRSLINELGAPLFIVPLSAKLKPIKQYVKQLTEFAKTIDADVFITHVCSEQECGVAYDKSVEKILKEMCAEINYTKIQYKAVLNTKTKQGLEWLIDNNYIDLLVLVHRHQDFFERIIRHSLSSKLATDVTIPLLVYKNGVNTFPVS